MSGLKKVANQICDEIWPKIEYLRPQVIKEIKGMLLEVRKCKVEAIDGESPIEK